MRTKERPALEHVAPVHDAGAHPGRAGAIRVRAEDIRIIPIGEVLER
jgi:hypothetical protein